MSSGSLVWYSTCHLFLFNRLQDFDIESEEDEEALIARRRQQRQELLKVKKKVSQNCNGEGNRITTLYGEGTMS